MFLLVVISILVVVICYVSFLCGVYNLCIRKRSNGSPVQNQSDHQQRITVQQLNDQIRLRPYDLPIMDSIVQDERPRRYRRPRTTVIGDLHQLHVDLRPYEFPIMNSNIIPSAPRLDPVDVEVDLPPSYEEAVKIKIYTCTY